MSIVNSQCVAGLLICLHEFQTGEKGERLLQLFVFTEGNMKKETCFLEEEAERGETRGGVHKAQGHRSIPHTVRPC